MNTLALTTPESDGGGWDLVIQDGTLAVNSGGLALAQDVASAVRVFRGECWYDTTRGLPYFEQILGQRVNLQFLKQALAAEGMTVPNVAAVKVFLTGPGRGREVGGQLQITSADGQIYVAETGNLLGVAPWWVNAVSPEAAGAAGVVLTGGDTPLTGGGSVLTQ